MKTIKKLVYPILFSTLSFGGCAANNPIPRLEQRLSPIVYGQDITISLYVKVNNQIFIVQSPNHSFSSGMTDLTRYMTLEERANQLIHAKEYDKERTWASLDLADGTEDQVIDPKYLEDFIKNHKHYSH